MARRVLLSCLVLTFTLLAAALTSPAETSSTPTSSSSSSSSTASSGTANNTTSHPPTANATSASSNATKDTPPPTASPGNYTYSYSYYPEKSYPTYTDSPYPYPAYPTKYPYPTAPNENYYFELEGKTIAQDVFVYSAKTVSIRDSTIYGNLFISSSGMVVLSSVQVSGKLGIDRSTRIDADHLSVGSYLGVSQSSEFNIHESRVGADLGVYRSTNGILRDIDVAGHVVLVESQVQQENVRSTSGYRFEGPTPEPLGYKVRLEVANSSLVFAHEKLLTADTSGNVQLDVSGFEAKARLELRTAKDPQRAAVHLESRFEKLIEYEDRDANGGYDLGDLVVREYLIHELPLTSIRQERLGDNESSGWVGRLDYGLPGGGRLSLIFTARDASADQTKIDVAIDNYAYGSSRSRLALQTRVASASDWDISSGETEDRLTFHGQDYDGFFSWVRTALADGRQTEVQAHVLEEHRTESGERELVVYLSYARGAHIFHDPSIGLVEALGLGDLRVPSLGNLFVYGSTLLAVLVVLWSIGTGGRRRTP